MVRDLFLVGRLNTLFCTPLGCGLWDACGEKNVQPKISFTTHRAPITTKIFELGYALPTKNQVVCVDLGMSPQALAAKIKGCDPAYITDKTRKVGHHLFHLFGRTEACVKGLVKLAGFLGNDIDRAAVANVTKQSKHVLEVYGEGCARVLTGPNMNAKKRMLSSWLPDMRRCGYLPRVAAASRIFGSSPAVAKVVPFPLFFGLSLSLSFISPSPTPPSPPPLTRKFQTPLPPFTTRLPSTGGSLLCWRSPLL